MIPMPHRLDRTIVIRASRDTVFRFFTDDRRWASWWGAGSAIDARKGGKVLIKHPGNVEAVGEVLDVDAPSHIVFTLGYPANPSMPPGSSVVTIHLSSESGGTRLQLTHVFAESAPRDEHIQGWRYQLALFANVITDEVCAEAATTADRWFAAWAEPDEARRLAELQAIARDTVTFRDRYSFVEGIADLMPHITAAQRFMPGIRMTRAGEVRHCQGTALVEWTAAAPDGQPRGAGTQVFHFDEAGRIESAVGLWKAAK